jgi:6-phosphofructokinase 1
VPYEPAHVAELLDEDRRSNPSNYAVVTISEGAYPRGGVAPASAQCAASAGRVLGDALSELSGEETLYQQVGYLTRSGAPDGLDLMVADNFAALALSLIDTGEEQHMVALQHGVYVSVPLGATSIGLKRVDVPELYDPEQYLPVITHVRGKPMFLY